MAVLIKNSYEVLKLDENFNELMVTRCTRWNTRHWKSLPSDDFFLLSCHAVIHWLALSLLFLFSYFVRALSCPMSCCPSACTVVGIQITYRDTHRTEVSAYAYFLCPKVTIWAVCHNLHVLYGSRVMWRFFNLWSGIFRFTSSERWSKLVETCPWILNKLF